MSGLHSEFEDLSLEERVEYVTSRTCSPETRSVIMYLQAELATAKGYWTGVSRELRQVEDQSSGLSRELRNCNAEYRDRVLELDTKLAAVTQKLAKMTLAYEMSEAVRAKGAEAAQGVERERDDARDQVEAERVRKERAQDRASWAEGELDTRTQALEDCGEELEKLQALQRDLDTLHSGTAPDSFGPGGAGGPLYWAGLGGLRRVVGDRPPMTPSIAASDLRRLYLDVDLPDSDMTILVQAVDQLRGCGKELADNRSQIANLQRELEHERVSGLRAELTSSQLQTTQLRSDIAIEKDRYQDLVQNVRRQLDGSRAHLTAGLSALSGTHGLVAYLDGLAGKESGESDV